MNFQQMRYLCGVADHELNLSKAAEVLHTSQPGISRQIRLLEEELHAELLVRQGNRITALTEPGQSAVEIARRILREIDNLRSVGADHADGNSGTLVVATTHVHARYILLPVIQHFKRRYPDVSLSLRQGTPDQVVQLLSNGEADIGLCSAPTSETPELARLPCYSVRRCVLLPRRHPLLLRKRVSLADLATYPMINLDSAFAAGVSVMSTFQAQGLQPNVVLTATDADVIKSYVAAGMGIATLPEIAFEPKRDKGLATMSADHLFQPSISYIWLHRHHYLRTFAADFISMLSRSWTRSSTERALRSVTVPDASLAINPAMVASQLA